MDFQQKQCSRQYHSPRACDIGKVDLGVGMRLKIPGRVRRMNTYG